MSMVNATKGDFASFVEWEITRKCNLACRHCCVGGRAARRDELSGKEALGLVGRLAELGCRSLTLSGGEPMLRPDWPDLASALHGAGVGVQLVTNGQTLGRREARWARQSGLRLVLLSLDGMRRNHDRLRRRRGAFSRVTGAADALVSRGVPVGFITTLVRHNVEDLEPLAELVQGFGAVVWQVWLGMPRDGSGLWLGPGHAAGVASRIESLRRHCPSLVPGDNLAGPGGPRPFGCEQGGRVLGIQSDGAVRGCLALPESCNVGSIRRLDLSILWARAHVRRRLIVKDMEGRCESPCHATALAWAGRRPMALAVRAGGGSRTLRGAGALAASLILASGIGAGCKAGPGRVTTNRPAEKNVTLDAAQASDVPGDPLGAQEPDHEPADVPEAKDPGPIDKAASWGLPFNASCICESEKKDEHGAPVDTQPCMCISHVMCPPSSMWICPSGYTKKIESGEDEGD